VRGRRPALLLALLPLTAGLWLVWPFLRPLVWPARGPAWLVVLDGYHRLDAALALQRRHRLPILLISCPLTGQPTPSQWRRARAPLQVLRQGFDTATQIAALGRWRPPGAGNQAPSRVLIVSDGFHLPRAALAARIALGSSGTRVDPLPVDPIGRPIGPLRFSPPPPTPPVLLWPLWRDALRLQLWRLSGSTGAFLRPQLLRHKQRLCWGPGS
jgi:uncharacterized SAM-binding protein YcdF (DUF218 family)